MKSQPMVRLKVPIVKAVIKDLVRFDGLKQELDQTKELLTLSKRKISLKDSVITTLNDKVYNLDEIITKKDNQYMLEAEKSKSLISELKQQKSKTFWWKVAAGAGLVLSLILGASN